MTNSGDFIEFLEPGAFESVETVDDGQDVLEIHITEAPTVVQTVPTEDLELLDLGPSIGGGEGGGSGTPGLSAYQIAVANGFVGTQTEWLESLRGDDGAPGTAGAPGAPGAPGAAGSAGASAYQVAVANGFVGTQTEWLESLKGEGSDLPLTIEVDPAYAGLRLRFGPGPLPTASEYPNTLYGVLPPQES